MWGGLENGLPKLYSLIPPTATAAWALKTIHDRNGNSITIEYDQIAGIEANFWAEEMYPRRITYARGRTSWIASRPGGRPVPFIGEAVVVFRRSRCRAVGCSCGPTTSPT
jgi:hypothetical protein